MCEVEQGRASHIAPALRAQGSGPRAQLEPAAGSWQVARKLVAAPEFGEVIREAKLGRLPTSPPYVSASQNRRRRFDHARSCWALGPEP